VGRIPQRERINQYRSRNEQDDPPNAGGPTSFLRISGDSEQKQADDQTHGRKEQQCVSAVEANHLPKPLDDLINHAAHAPSWPQQRV